MESDLLEKSSCFSEYEKSLIRIFKHYLKECLYSKGWSKESPTPFIFKASKDDSALMIIRSDEKIILKYSSKHKDGRLYDLILSNYNFFEDTSIGTKLFEGLKFLSDMMICEEMMDDFGLSFLIRKIFRDQNRSRWLFNSKKSLARSKFIDNMKNTIKNIDHAEDYLFDLSLVILDEGYSSHKIYQLGFKEVNFPLSSEIIFENMKSLDFEENIEIKDHRVFYNFETNKSVHYIKFSDESKFLLFKREKDERFMELRDILDSECWRDIKTPEYSFIQIN